MNWVTAYLGLGSNLGCREENLAAAMQWLFHLGLFSSEAITIAGQSVVPRRLLADRIAIIRNGRIVAQGTASQLMQDYLGNPVMELRVDGPLDGAVNLLPDEVNIREQGEDWIRFQSPDPQQVNPRIIENMAAAGVRIVTLSEVRRSLEEVYLSVMDREAQE